jgi:hypothetical protein
MFNLVQFPQKRHFLQNGVQDQVFRSNLLSKNHSQDSFHKNIKLSTDILFAGPNKGKGKKNPQQIRVKRKESNNLYEKRAAT